MNLLHVYKNGNYIVQLFDDGTKIRETIDPNATEFLPEISESIDLKITDYCDVGCPMCYANSSMRGKHADLDLAFLDTIPKGTEIALGGGEPLTHPYLDEFLKRLRHRGIVPSITTNEHSTLYSGDLDYLCRLMSEKLIYGVGISVAKRAIDDPILLPKRILDENNVVLHYVAGYHSVEEIKKMAGLAKKILILGYKNIGRGKDYLSLAVIDRIKKLKEALPELLLLFDVVSFDNLAIEQLEPQRLVSKERWDGLYMGDDGKFTFYIDAVNQTFSKNSLESEDKAYPVMGSVKEMFNFLQEKR